MINFINDDLIEAMRIGNETLVLHQVNCVKEMGSGFAKHIAQHYPIVQQRHKHWIASQNHTPLFGDAIASYHDESNLTIVNLYSQFYPGNCSNKEFRFPKLDVGLYLIDNFTTRTEIGLRSALKQFLKYCDFTLHSNIAMPLIASGIGADLKRKRGLSDLEYFIKYIEPIVAGELADLPVNVYHL